MHIRLSGIVGLLIAIVCTAAIAQTSQPAVPEQDKRLEVLRKLVTDSIDAFDKASKLPNTRFDARQLTLYAHYVLVMNQPPAKAEAALKRVMAIQQMDPKSPRFGEFSATEGESLPEPAKPDELSANSAVTEVTVLPMAQILIRYGEKISPQLRDQMTESLRAALGVIRKNQFPMDVANVYLQSAADELLIGEVVNDPKAISEAESRLTTFATVARSRGVEEYSAPNFSAVQLSAALIAQNYTLQPDAKRILDPIVKFLWAQIAANVVPNRGELGGPHSRELDFIYGMGAVDGYLFLEGMRDITPNIPQFGEGLRAYLNFVERAWRPDDDVRKLALGSRVVKSRWGLVAGHDRYFYVAEDFAMGSVSAPASMNDRQLTFEFPTRALLPAIWFVSDPYDAPYGRVRGRDGAMMWPNHYITQIASVQEKGMLLALTNIRNDVRGQPAGQIAANVVFPADAQEVRIDGKLIPTAKPFQLDVPANATLFIRIGPGALVAKFFDVDGVFGQKPMFQLKYDGNPFHVARLVAYQLRTDPAQPRRPIPDQPIRAGIIFLGEGVHDVGEVDALLRRAQNAKLESTLEASAWHAKLIDGKTTLEAGLDVQSGAILFRKVNGAEYLPASFTVNDVDVAGAILGY